MAKYGANSSTHLGQIGLHKGRVHAFNGTLMYHSNNSNVTQLYRGTLFKGSEKMEI